MADLPIPQVVNSLDVDEDKAYEPPYDIRWSVNRETTGTDTITMGRTIIPPRGCNALHFHKSCDTTIYVVKGPINIYCERGRGDSEKGDSHRPFRLFPLRVHPRPGEPEHGRAGGADIHLRRDAQQGSGGDGRRYPWDVARDAMRANLKGGKDGFPGVAPVGRFPKGARPFGALDMSGNAWEWVADRYGSRAYRKMAERDPHGPAKGKTRVVRGASRGSPVAWATAHNRYRRLPDYTNNKIGFRCAAGEGS